jgi:hypothetical protein
VGASEFLGPPVRKNEGSFLPATFGRSDESLPHSHGDSVGTMMCLPPYQGPRQEDPSFSRTGYAELVSIVEHFDASPG